MLITNENDIRCNLLLKLRQKRNEEKKNKECNLREKFRISIENIITRKGVNEYRKFILSGLLYHVKIGWRVRRDSTSKVSVIRRNFTVSLHDNYNEFWCTAFL
ncbi:hypothetical protein RIR_jg19075.t1 [Rhizophagus irregularis DAOM 181602=DAOM 197198]|nr:hypothetical protein RIR_jg19075.t1 [Rhizophagus irregularis DAOM 181602=DAOM 197198]